jgi:hypothetical protein
VRNCSSAAETAIITAIRASWADNEGVSVICGGFLSSSLPEIIDAAPGRQ